MMPTRDGVKHQPTSGPPSEPRLALIADVYTKVSDSVDTSFEVGGIGVDLCNLMGAIATNLSCELWVDSNLTQILLDHYQPGHRLWDFISLGDEDEIDD